MSYQGKNAHFIHWYHENLVWTFPRTKEGKLVVANGLLWCGWSKELALKVVREDFHVRNKNRLRGSSK